METTTSKQSETIERLQRELAETTQEKIQAAEYGLAVLSEKQRLQAHVESVEAQLEAARSELELTRGALEKYNRTLKRQTQVGAEEDEQRALETAQRESDYTQQILDLEMELRSAKHLSDELRNENGNLSSQNGELRLSLDRLERERVSMKSELRDVRSRESRLASDFSELEEENIQLQKQIAHLRASQLELDAARHEVARLDNELVTLTGQLDETVRLKSIIERQLEETLVLLQGEREQKYALKRDLDSVRVAGALPSGAFMNTSLNASVSMSMLNAAAFLNVSASNGKLNDSASSSRLPEAPANTSVRSQEPDDVEKAYLADACGDAAKKEYLRQTSAHQNAPAESEPETDDLQDDASSEPGQEEPATEDLQSADDPNSLFAEVRRSELCRVQDLLAAAESDKQELQRAQELLAAAEGDKQEFLARLAERERLLDAAKRDLLVKQQQLDRLQVYCTSISTLNEVAALQDDDAHAQAALVQSASSVSLVTHSASACSLQPDAEAHEAAAGSEHKPKERRESASDTKERVVRQYEVRYAAALKQIASLTLELRRVEDRLAVERSGKSESQIRDELVDLRSSLAGLEREKRERENLARQRAERANTLRRVAAHLAKRYFDLLAQLGTLRNKQPPDALRAERERVERPLLDSTDEALPELRDESLGVLESDLLDAVRHPEADESAPSATQDAERAPPTPGDVELREQLARMREALVTKREQVVTLRNLLKANKTAAELGVANLREKYETERSTVAETIRHLRDELRTLKEDAAQFASLRCMFHQRCDEYAAQLDEVRTLLRAADEERLTLSGSLKIALGQKMALAQRVDSLERERERTRSRRAAPRHGPPAESSPSHDRRTRYPTSKLLPVYAGQNAPSLARFAPPAHAFSHATPNFVPAVAPGSTAPFNPLASPFNPTDPQMYAFPSEQSAMEAAPSRIHYPREFDLAGSQSDAAAYIHLIRQALALGVQPQPYGPTQSLSNAIESQISNALSGSSVHQIVQPTAVYPQSPAPPYAPVPASPSRFAASPSPLVQSNSSGASSPYVNPKVVNGSDRAFTARQ